MRSESIGVEPPLAPASRRWSPAIAESAGSFAAHDQAFGVVYVVWGSTYLAIRVGVESIPPWARPGGARPTRGAALGIAMGLLGMALLVRPGPDAVGASHWEGVAALAIAGMCWALGSLYARYRPMHPNRAASSGHQMIAAARPW